MKSLVPFGSCALLALALTGCSPSNDANNAAPSNTSAQAPNAASNTATDNSAVVSSTGATPTTTQRASLIATVWVPGHDDKLHITPVSKAALAAQKKFGDPAAALDDIIRMAPTYYPPKTRVRSFHDDGKTVSVNLSHDLVNPQFWSKAGELKTTLALYAIINTASTATGTQKPVVLKTDNNPVSEIGQLSMDGEIDPDPKLQAGAGGSSSAPPAGGEAGGA